MPRGSVIWVILLCLWLTWPPHPVSAERGPYLVQLRQALSQNPRDPEANYKLGKKYQEMGRPRQALKYLKEAIRLKPDYPEALSALATLQSGEENYGHAVSDLGKLMKLQPKSEKLKVRASKEYNQNGIASFQSGNFAEAEKSFKEAASLDPKASVPLNNLGVAYFNAGRPKEGAATLREALQREPDNPVAHYNLGISYVAQGNMVAAYAESLALRSMDPALAHQLDILSSPPRTPLSGPYPGTKEAFEAR
jgi:Flp pilus assembly protein TadD